MNFENRIAEIHAIDGMYNSAVEDPMLKVIEELSKDLARINSLDLSKMEDKRSLAINIQKEKLKRHIAIISSSLIFIEKYKENFQWRIQVIKKLYCDNDSHENSQKWANDKIMIMHNETINDLKEKGINL